MDAAAAGLPRLDAAHFKLSVAITLLALLSLPASTLPFPAGIHPLSRAHIISPLLRSRLHSGAPVTPAAASIPGLPDGYTLTYLGGNVFSGSPSADGGIITVNLVFHGNVSWWQSHRVGKWKKGKKVTGYIADMFGSMSSNATKGTLKGYWAAVGKNYPGKSGPVGSKIAVQTLLSDFVADNSLPDISFNQILNFSHTNHLLSLDNNTISLIFTSPGDPAVNLTVLYAAGYCSSWCYALGAYVEPPTLNIYAVIPDASGCPACSILPPAAGVTHPPMVSNATAALAEASSSAFTGIALLGPSVGGYLIFNGTTFQPVGAACQNTYPDVKTSNPMWPKSMQWQYNLKGVTFWRYLLSGTLQNSTLTCVIK